MVFFDSKHWTPSNWINIFKTFILSFEPKTLCLCVRRTDIERERENDKHDRKEEKKTQQHNNWTEHVPNQWRFDFEQLQE